MEMDEDVCAEIPVSITIDNSSIPLITRIYISNGLFKCATATLDNAIRKLRTRHAATKASCCIAIRNICNQFQSKLS